MPFPMKIQPIDSDGSRKETIRNDQAVKPSVVKSRLKRLFEWQFSTISKNCQSVDDFEPNSVCLAKMVQNFIEESTNNDKQSVAVKCSRYHCFHGNCSDSSSDNEFYFIRRSGSGDSINAASTSITAEFLKKLVSCLSETERNLLADTTKIIERNHKVCNCKRKDDCRKALIESLVSIGYNASICKSKWEKSSSYPAGEYEYIDVIIEGERFIIDIDFKSEFEIARSTGTYKSVLQSVPSIFVGKADRLQKIVSIVSDAAKQSLQKKGMHIPPWRKTEYMKAKWFSPYKRTEPVLKSQTGSGRDTNTCSTIKTKNFAGEFELFFKQNAVEEKKIKVVVTPWEPPAIKPKSTQKGTKIVAGLASALKEKT